MDDHGSALRASSTGALGLFVGLLLLGGVARAAGIEETEAGAVGLGRAAYRLRVDDFMATWHNPANLALLPGADLGAELRLPLMQACFDRAKDNSLQYQEPKPDEGVTGFESFEKVCNDALPMPTGQLGFAQGFDEGWGYGIGFFTPAAISSYRYGDDVIITNFALAGEVAPATTSGVESPNRFLLLERRAIAGFLMAGVGAQPIPALRVGLSAGLGFAYINNRSVASVQGGTFLDQEILLDLNATDYVIPRFTASVVVQPASGLEAMLSLSYQDDIRASGWLDLHANGFQGVPLTKCDGVDTTTGSPIPNPGSRCRIEDVELTVPLPTLEAVLGLRYAARRKPRERALDPLVDEKWDVEVDGYWSQTSHVDEYRVKLYSETPGSPGSPHIAFSTAPGAFALAAPPEAVIPRNWKDTFGIRAGGDINLVPARLAMRLGVSYESRAVPVEMMNIDVFPVNKLGVHLGATAGLGDLRLHVAYAHLFYQPVDVPVGRGEVREIVSQNPGDVLPVNEGNYTAALDVISVGGSLRF